MSKRTGVNIGTVRPYWSLPRLVYLPVLLFLLAGCASPIRFYSNKSTVAEYMKFCEYGYKGKRISACYYDVGRKKDIYRRVIGGGE